MIRDLSCCRNWCSGHDDLKFILYPVILIYLATELSYSVTVFLASSASYSTTTAETTTAFRTGSAGWGSGSFGGVEVTRTKTATTRFTATNRGGSSWSSN